MVANNNTRGDLAMTMPCNTRMAAAAIGCAVSTLEAAVYRGKVPAPAKDHGGRYLWSKADVDRARARAALAVDRRRRRGQQQPA
jgi:hypothetical protein